MDTHTSFFQIVHWNLTAALSASGLNETVRLFHTRHRATMRWRAGLGQRSTALPAPTAHFVSVLSAWLLPVPIAVRDWPFALFERTLRQRQQSADEQPPAAPTGQGGTGAPRTAPPLMLAPPCFLLPCLMKILIES